jgi:ankyrin repeat protein
MQAVYADSLTLVYLLLSHGATVEIEDNQNRTALHLAAQLNRTKIIDGIIHHKRVTNPLMVDLLNANGETPLIFAVKNGQFTAADILILRGADPNKADKDGRFPLHFAVELEDERLTKYLLRNLAFPYKIDMLGTLPIALSTVPLIISYLEDAYAQYSAEFRMYEEVRQYNQRRTQNQL